MANLNIPAETMVKIEPLIEQAATARAAANYYWVQGEQSVDLPDIKDAVAGAVESQAKAGKYANEASNLLAQARQICREAGCSLPGWENGLLDIADNYSKRMDRQAR